MSQSTHMPEILPPSSNKMITNRDDIMNRGMQCLTDAMGVVDAEQFISIKIRERFDYTKWQRQYFDAMQPNEFHEKTLVYAKTHPYNGNATRL